MTANPITLASMRAIERWPTVATTLLVVTLGGCARPVPTVPMSPGIALPETLQIRSGDRVVEVPLEDYVLGTVLAEIGPANDTPETTEAIYELQSILSRTYAVFHRNRHRAEGFDLCDSTHCQVYRPARIGTSSFADEAKRAVASTRHTILMYGARPVEALFHADCGGHTADAEVVWGNAVPYLVGTVDAVADRTHRTWTYSLSREALRAALNGSSRTHVGDRLRSLRVVSWDASGRAASMEAVGDEAQLFRGEQLRAAVNLIYGAEAIRSTRFTLTLAGDTYRFAGTGWGHGVGLCQVGAMARLRRGESVASILATYYPGVRLLRVS